MARKPISAERKAALLENLARGRATRAANLAAGISPAKAKIAVIADASAAALPPDVAALVEAELTKRLPAMLAAVAQANGIAKNESPESFAAVLALQLAKFTGQGTGKTYVDPEELQKRDRGKQEMLRLIRECRATETAPEYRIIKQTQLDVPPFGPIVIEPLWRGPDRINHDTEIGYRWIPNLAMVPINDSAKRIFAQFEIWVAAEMPEVADPEGDALAEAAAQHVTSQGGSPLVSGPGLGPQMALNPHTGMVFRGAAAAAVIRNDPALRAQQFSGPMNPQQAAMIRRGEDPAVRKKQVLGTLTDPIEMR